MYSGIQVLMIYTLFCCCISVRIGTFFVVLTSESNFPVFKLFALSELAKMFSWFCACLFFSEGTHMVTIQDAQGYTHNLSRYYAKWNKPRPESSTIVWAIRHFPPIVVAINITCFSLVFLYYYINLSGQRNSWKTSKYLWENTALPWTGISCWIWVGF